MENSPDPAASVPSAAALAARIAQCTLCQGRFALTATAHHPRPVPWFSARARILIAGQAPGARVQAHASGRPFVDASGDRLRQWLGLEEAVFYDQSRIAIVPMAFCFPGYDAKGSDLPPPPLCAATWHDEVMAALSQVRLVIPVGLYAARYHLRRLGAKSAPLAQVVRQGAGSAARHFGPQTRCYPLPHPSWRNTGWLKKNPWFEAEILPALRQQVTDVL
ncbi:uracil-DNA glycosylase family protein [Aquimixticola soesokkakensis]|nr:uracil-DNA glycosylase family protein [Aquimixticola soesokkakensis]